MVVTAGLRDADTIIGHHTRRKIANNEAGVCGLTCVQGCAWQIAWRMYGQLLNFPCLADSPPPPCFSGEVHRSRWDLMSQTSEC
nr:unnamed protein product [Haemonchus contortus]